MIPVFIFEKKFGNKTDGEGKGFAVAEKRLKVVFRQQQNPSY
jgi:hypothetical protein